MRIQVAIPEEHVEADVLDAALESVTRLNEKQLAQKQVPYFGEAVRRGVRWRPEPPGQEHFDHAAKVVSRGWGDCDDLAPYHAATLRHTGEDPEAFAFARRSGPKRWHAVVRRGDGSVDDPSKTAGMGQPVIGVAGASVPFMCGGSSSSVVGAYLLRPQIALRPVRGAYQARADLPWQWRESLDEKPSPTDMAMTTLHTAPLAATALTGAIEGAIVLGTCSGAADPDHLARLAAISDACNGIGYGELCGVYGLDHADAAMQVVGSFFTSGAAGTTLLISNTEAKDGAAQALTDATASDDVKKIALMLHQNASGKRPDDGTLTAAIMKFLTTTQGPVIPGSADQHARLLIADQAAKRLMRDPWFLKQMSSTSVGGLFDFIAKAAGSIGKAVGSAVKAAAPIVATVAPIIPGIGPAIAGAAALAGAVAAKAMPSKKPAAAPAPASNVRPAFVPSPRPVGPTIRAAAPAVRAAPVAPRPAAPLVPAGSAIVPGGVPGSAAIHQGGMFHVVPFG